MPDAAQEEDNGDIPPAFLEDMMLREMNASFKSNKGALTRLSNQVKVRAETFIAIKSPGSASQLNKLYNKFLASATSCTGRLTNWLWRTKKTPLLGQLRRNNYSPCRKLSRGYMGTKPLT